MKSLTIKNSMIVLIVGCIVLINLMGWNMIGDIRVNLVLAAGAVLAIFIRDIGLLLALFIALLISIQWQPVVGKDIFVLGGILIAFLVLRRYAPWLPIVTLLVFIISGTALFYIALIPTTILGMLPVLLAEAVYNGSIGLLLFLIFEIIYGKTFQNKKYS